MLNAGFDEARRELRLSARGEPDFFIRIDTHKRNEIVLYTGSGTANDRIRCHAAKALEEHGVPVIVEGAVSLDHQLHILLADEKDIVQVQKALLSFFEEVTTQ
jgi:hypothetical protein